MTTQAERHTLSGDGASEIDTSIGGFRPDIEGLRAVAVVLVILDHLGTYPHGGFIGVDVFFVISGFLITGLLVKEAAATGRISWLDFYKRRVRRILPASLTVLLVCWFVAKGALRGARVSEAHSDILWALGFSANIHFAHIGTDYFDANRPPSPVQHYWSLAVEEQFYIVWPIVLLIVLSLIARRLQASTTRTMLLLITSAVVVGSFAWGVYNTSTNPAAAYFSTFTRAWELGVGALIAITLSRWPNLPNRLGRSRGPLVLLGVAGIIASAEFVKSNGSFPTPGAAGPVIAAAVVILGGAGLGESKWSTVLTNPIAGYIGRISFSLYLWHYPAIVFGDALIPHRPVAWYFAVVGATVGLSILSYEFIETPFRRPINLRGRLRTDGARDSLDEVTPRLWKSGIAGLLGIAVMLLGYDYQPQTLGAANLEKLASAVAPQAAAQTKSNIAPVPATLTAAIGNALDSTSFPHLDPPISHLGLTAAEQDWNGCRTATTLLATCTFHDPSRPTSASKVAVVLGDSMSLAYLPTIKAALLPGGWTIYGLARELCPSADVATEAKPGVPSSSAECTAHQQWALSETRALNPTLVLMASATGTLTRLSTGATGNAAARQYQAGLEETERALAAPGRQIVTLAPPPEMPSLITCDTAGAHPSDCVSSVQDVWFLQSQADAAAAAATHTTYLDTHLWYCSAAFACPSFVGTTPVFYDGEHITKAYALELTSELLAALKPPSV